MKLDHDRLYLLTSIKARGLVVQTILRDMIGDAQIVDMDRVPRLRAALVEVERVTDEAFASISAIHDELHRAGLLKEA